MPRSSRGLQLWATRELSTAQQGGTRQLRVLREHGCMHDPATPPPPQPLAQPLAQPLPPPLAQPLRPPQVQSPPRVDRWPIALQHAFKLRGALVPCGPGLRGVAWPDTSSVRLATLGPWLHAHAAASHLTAAWVWGAARHPGEQLTFTTHSGRRPPPTHPHHISWHQLTLNVEDLRTLGDFTVTSPERTAFDLLHCSSGFNTAEQVACRLLVRSQPVLNALRERVFSRRRPHSTLARARFELLSRLPSGEETTAS